MKQSSSDFKAAVIIHSDLRVQKEEICHYFHIFPFYLPWSNGVGCHDLSFLIFSFKPALLLSSLTLIKSLFNSPLLSAIRVVLSEYLRLLVFLPPILITAATGWHAAQDRVARLWGQSWCEQAACWTCWILTQSVVPYRVASWPTYRFLRKQVRWSGIPISLRAFHSLSWYTDKGFSVVDETEKGIFLEFPCFVYDPLNVGHFSSGSSSFSEPSFNIWKFLVHIKLKPSMQDFKHDLTSMGVRLGVDCGSDHELLIGKFRLKLKKVRITTRLFRYDLNQIP